MPAARHALEHALEHARVADELAARRADESEPPAAPSPRPDR
ncbi:hypothetical protein [Streptosporangium sp. NPDC001681]